MLIDLKFISTHTQMTTIYYYGIIRIQALLSLSKQNLKNKIINKKFDYSLRDKKLGKACSITKTTLNHQKMEMSKKKRVHFRDEILMKWIFFLRRSSSTNQTHTQ